MFEKESYQVLNKNQNLYIVIKNIREEDECLRAQVGDLIILTQNYLTLPEKVECKNINTHTNGIIYTEKIVEFIKNPMTNKKIHSLIENKMDSHFLGTFNPFKPIYCYHCCDFIWGKSNSVVICFCIFYILIRIY